MIDPTTRDRQGPDAGSQYRSEIFAADPVQQHIAEVYIRQLSAAQLFGAAIVTRVSPLHGFYTAEGYHQDYLVKHPDAPYIVFNDLPKIETLKRFYPDLYRAQPVVLAKR